MTVRLTDNFRGMYKKSDVRVRNQFNKNLEIFIKNPFDPQLNNHSLRKEWTGYKSINITADFRAIFKEVVLEDGEVLVYFEALGTHKDLYK